MASKWTAILVTLHKFGFLLHCQASQMDTSKLSQANFIKRWTVNRTNNLPLNSWGVPLKIGAKKILHLFGFLKTSTLNG